MKDITFITTTAACDDTFDKIEHLNKCFSATLSKQNIVILSGNFATDVFEWVDSETNPSYQRYANQHPAKEITEDRYGYYLDVLPPIYFSDIDGTKVSGGFCVAEAYTHTPQGFPVFTACYQYEGKYWETLAILLKTTHKFVCDYNAQEFSRDNYAISY